MNKYHNFEIFINVISKIIRHILKSLAIIYTHSRMFYFLFIPIIIIFSPISNNVNALDKKDLFVPAQIIIKFKSNITSQDVTQKN
jgi:hypothetical protein